MSPISCKTTEKEEVPELVVCFHCGKHVPKDEAFYIEYHDTYLCPKHYHDLLEGKPIRLSNWKRRGV